MGDKHDSWLSGIGVDVGSIIDSAAKTVEDTASNVVQGAKAVVQKAESVVSSAVTTVVKTVANAASPGGPAPATAPKAGPADGAGASSLGESVGRGGKNKPDDVTFVQRALGLSEDGKCGPQTIGAIEKFQKSLNQAKPDGRIDPGGPTLRALVSGGKAAPTPPAPDKQDDGGLLGRLAKGAEDLAGDAKALGGKILHGAEELADDAKNLGGKVIRGAKEALDDPNSSLGSGAAANAGGLKLSLDRLLPNQITAAHKFLEQHGFGATQVSGIGALLEDYQPVLDGKPTTIDAVVQALKAEVKPLPLQNPTSALRDLVDQRYRELAVQEMKAADERNKRIVQSGAKVDPLVSRDDAKKDLTAFLEKVLTAQGGKDLKVTGPVRLAGQAVAHRLSGPSTAIASFLQGKSLPGRPAALASEITKFLPPGIPRSNLDLLDRIPVKETPNGQPQSLAEALGAVFSKDLERIIGFLPKSLQDEIRKAVADAVAAGIVAIAERAMKDSPLDDKAKKEISSIVEATIKLKANEPPMDRKQDGEGSPNAREQAPSVAPTPPESPEDENIFKIPEIKLPDGTPSKTTP